MKAKLLSAEEVESVEQRLQELLSPDLTFEHNHCRIYKTRDVVIDWNAMDSDGDPTILFETGPREGEPRTKCAQDSELAVQEYTMCNVLPARYSSLFKEYMLHTPSLGATNWDDTGYDDLLMAETGQWTCECGFANSAADPYVYSFIRDPNVCMNCGDTTRFSTRSHETVDASKSEYKLAME